jgi:hypothetical protein
MSALGQKRTSERDMPNDRSAPEAAVRWELRERAKAGALGG